MSGTVGGVRIRKNFKSREDAAAEKSVLEIRAIQRASGLRTVATTLTDDQVREAEAVFRRLADRTRPLSFYIDYALTNHREPAERKPLPEAISEYVAAKNREFEQDHISDHQMRRIRWDLGRLEKHFRGKSVAELTVTSLVAYLELRQPSLKTYNNRRGTLSTFFKFAFLRGWIVDNPILRIPQHRLRQRRGSAPTLSVAQAREFMEFMEGHEGGIWVPYYALCLFAGVRPGVPGGEIHKLQPDAVRLDEGVIRISAEVSKVREPRKIVIQPNLAAWLRAYPLDKFPIIVGNFKKRRERFAKRFSLSHDVMRHTFISMLVAKHRSFGEAALQAGNSESIIRRHYLDLKTSAEAEEFFNIYPKRAAAPAAEPEGNIIQLPPASAAVA